MKYTFSRFGELELQDSEIFHFPEGLYGFEKEKKFAFLPFAQEVETPLEWMQSIQTPDLALVVTYPNAFIPEYKATLLDDEKAQIQLGPEEEYLIRVIVTIPAIFTEMTGNLVAPIAINPKKKIAKQFILTSPEYDTRHFLFPEEVRKSNVSQV